MNPDHPWFTYPFLIAPKRVLENLQRRVTAGLTNEAPNAWQLSLGVMRMWHRNLFRTETVGTSPAGKVRNNWRAKLLHNRSLRLPFLLAQGAVAPHDMTGLVSSKEAIIRHLLGAHHDGLQFVFDLELLSAHEGALEELEERTRSLVESDNRASRWMRDLTVYEGYHESLLATTRSVIARGIQLEPGDRWNADITLAGYLSWCVQQPKTPEATWRAYRTGEFRFDSPPMPAGGNA